MIGSITIDPGWVQAVFLIATRLAALLLVTPILAALSVSPMVRVVLVFALATVLAMGLPHARLSRGFELGTLVGALASEAAVGALLGLGVLVGFGAFSLAGSLLDVQAGFGIAQVFDPVTRRQVPILTSLFEQLALVVFILGNGHHLLLRGLAYSIERFPPGDTSWLAADAGPVFQHMAGLFTLGLALVAPVVFFLLLLDFVLGVLTRNLPQMQMFALAIPLKIVVGVAVLALWLTSAQPLMARAYASIFQSWEALLR